MAVNHLERKAGPGKLCTAETVRDSLEFIYKSRRMQWPLWSLLTLNFQCVYYSVINLYLFYYVLCVLFEFTLQRSQVWRTERRPERDPNFKSAYYCSTKLRIYKVQRELICVAFFCPVCELLKSE